MRRRKMVAVLISFAAGAAAGAILAMVCLWLWFERACTHEMTLVHSSAYAVSTPGKRGIFGRTYLLGRGRYLVVLNANWAEHVEGYYISPATKEIGLAPVGLYVPFPGHAFVDRGVYDGLHEDGVLRADWNIGHGWKEPRIRIRGFQGEDTDGRGSKVLSERMPIGYENEIVLTRP